MRDETKGGVQGVRRNGGDGREPRAQTPDRRGPGTLERQTDFPRLTPGSPCFSARSTTVPARANHRFPFGIRTSIGMWCLLAVVFSSGCATSEKSSLPAPSLVWPAPPDAPRIAYVRSVSGPGDVGIRLSAGARALRWIFGSNKEAEALVKPFGIALDEEGNLCITDTGANAVCFHDRTRKTWQRWNRIGTLRFASPVSVAKLNGTLFVADSSLALVVAFSEKGALLFTITNRLQRPAGLAIDGERLFVVDSARHAVLIFDLSGNYLSEFGQRGARPGEFNYPTHIAADMEGNLYVTDSMNARVQMFDRAGTFKAQLGSAGDAPGHFGRPKGLAVDSFGHVYVVDGLFDTVQVFDRTGPLLLNFGGSGSKPGEFWLANGLAISRTNEVYVADAYNRRVQVFKYVGGQP
jgi:DNA-binding beta-propeller fold protein YncE